MDKFDQFMEWSGQWGEGWAVLIMFGAMFLASIIFGRLLFKIFDFFRPKEFGEVEEVRCVVYHKSFAVVPNGPQFTRESWQVLVTENGAGENHLIDSKQVYDQVDIGSQVTMQFRQTKLFGKLKGRRRVGYRINS